MSRLSALVKLLDKNRVAAGNFLDILLLWFRDVLMFKATKDTDSLIFHDEVQHIRAQADRCTYEGIEKIIEAIGTAAVRIKANVSFDLAIELLMLTIQENS